MHGAVLVCGRRGREAGQRNGYALPWRPASRHPPRLPRSEHCTQPHLRACLPRPCLLFHRLPTRRQCPPTSVHVSLVLVLLAVHAVPALIVCLVDVATVPHALQHSAHLQAHDFDRLVGNQYVKDRRPLQPPQVSLPMPRSCRAATTALPRPPARTSDSCLASVVRMKES